MPSHVEQEIKFCTTRDKVRIAYSLAGEGPPFVKAANWMNHLEYDWTSPVWRHLVEEFASDQQFLRYDQRGTGLSDRRVDGFSLDAFVNDLEAVVDAVGLDRFPLFAISQGGPVAIAYAARHPEKVSHLILLGTFATGWKRIPDLGKNHLEKRKAQSTLIRAGWGDDNPAFRQLWTTLCIPEATPDEAASFNEVQKASASAETAAAIFESIGEFDVSDLLPKLDLPVLVLHTTDDAVIDFEDGRRVAASIPGAKFVTLESRNHLLLSHEPAWQKFVDEVRRFLGRERTVPVTMSETRVCPNCGISYSGEMFYCLDDGARLTSTAGLTRSEADDHEKTRIM